LQEDIDKYNDRISEGWDEARSARYERMKNLGLINCPLAPLEPGIWPDWNLSTEEIRARFGDGEISRAVPWKTLTAEQKSFQRTKMAIHAAMIDRMDQQIGRVLNQLRAINGYENTVIVKLSQCRTNNPRRWPRPTPTSHRLGKTLAADRRYLRQNSEAAKPTQMPRLNANTTG